MLLSTNIIKVHWFRFLTLLFIKKNLINMDIDWEQRLKKEFDKVYFKNLKIKIDDFYANETIFPEKSPQSV